MDRTEWICVSVFCAMVAALLFCLYMGVTSSIERKRFLMQQCMQDGKKEYECEAMLAGNKQIVPMPIIIPMGR